MTLMLSPTLLDLMTVVPLLHPIQLELTQTSQISILRKVSKEFSKLAATAVTSSEVHLGEGGFCPTPQQAVKLLAGACLQKFKVTVTVASGMNAPSVAQQQSSCTAQMSSVLTGMGLALNSVTCLELAVVHLHGAEPADGILDAAVSPNPRLERLQKRIDYQVQQKQLMYRTPINMMQAFKSLSLPREWRFPHTTSPPPPEAICLEIFGVVAASAFAMLAAAVPNLQELHLAGCCWDASLAAFGSFCPSLVSLCVEAPIVPTQALKQLGSKLPNLTSLTISSSEYFSHQDAQLISYADAILPETRSCTKLAHLCIEYKDFIYLGCSPESWLELPASLQHFSCTCPFAGTNYPLECLLRRIPSLDLSTYPFKSLDDLFTNFPVLTTMRVKSSDTTLTLDCDPDDDESYRLKDALLSGKLTLMCPSLAFVGTCKHVRDMLAWFPPFPETSKVSVLLEGGVGAKVDCLERLPEVFPKLHCFKLEGESRNQHAWGEDMGFLRSLKRCESLRKLELLCPQLTLTKPTVVQLCVETPVLRDLSIRACWGFSKEDLLAEFKGLGRSIDVDIRNVWELSSSDDD